MQQIILSIALTAGLAALGWMMKILITEIFKLILLVQSITHKVDSLIQIAKEIPEIKRDLLLVQEKTNGLEESVDELWLLNKPQPQK